MGHGHHHHHIDPASGDRRVLAAVLVNLGLTVAQILAGILSGSLALIADAIHNLSDAVSLVIAFWARRIARRPSDHAMTFGYGRAEVVAALVNYTTLIVIGLYLVWEGAARLIDPPGVEGWLMVIVAGIALVVDLATAALTYSMSKSSVNIRAAFLHNVADALGSVAVIVAGTLILLYDWRLVDPIVTLGIAGYILWQSALGLVPVVRILMLGKPEGMETEEVLTAIRAVDGAADVHHLHLWQMQEGRAAVQGHIVLAPGADPVAVRGAVKDVLQARFGIDHALFEMERPEAACDRAQVVGHPEPTGQ